MLDSGATKSVVRALHYLVNQHREEIPVNSAAGVTHAEGLGDLRVLLGDLADSIIIQVPALAMSQCPVDILAVRQLVTLGFRLLDLRTGSILETCRREDRRGYDQSS